jgi:hypothetical protein
VAGIRIRLKNIQIDGNELITLVPTMNLVRDPFSRWSNWFVGEIYIDPRSVVPNARRDNFEEDARWLAIREELSRICSELTAEARRVSKEHQISLEMIDKKRRSSALIICPSSARRPSTLPKRRRCSRIVTNCRKTLRRPATERRPPNNFGLSP